MKLVYFRIGVIVFALSTSSIAHSQLEEIIVTSQKREQTLEEIPIAISYFDGETLERQNVTGVRDLGLSTPSFTAAGGFNPLVTNYIIRGLGSAGTDPGVEQSVGFFIDGIFRSRAAATLGDFLDVERVEVLKGPQGSILGRNTSAGAIVISLKQPEDEFGGELQLDYGRFDTIGTKGSVTGPLSDNVSYRVSGSFRERNEATVENIAGSGSGGYDRTTARGQVLWNISDLSSLRVTVDYSDIDEDCCIPVSNFYPLSGIALLNATGATIPGLPGKPGVVNGVAGVHVDPFDRVVANNSATNTVVDDKGISLHFDHDFEWANFTTIGVYREYESEFVQDYDDTDSLVLDFPGPGGHQSDEYSFEMRLSGEGDFYDWVTGTYYFHQEFNAFRTIESFGIVNQGGDIDIDNYAVFGNTTVRLGERWSMTAGLRYTNEEKEIVFFGSSAVTPFINANTGIPVNLEEDQVIGDLAFSYELGELGSFYLRYGRGYKSPGINLFATGLFISSFEDIGFGSEKSDVFELGSKLRLSDSTSLNLAVYHQQIDDLQVVVGDIRSFSEFVQNVGKAVSSGVDLDLVWQPDDRWLVSGGVGYLKAEYGDFMNGPPPIVTSSNAPFQDLSGEPLLQAPDWSVSGSIGYTLPILNGLDLVTQVDFSYRGAHFVELSNSDFLANDATTLVNFSMLLELPDQWSIQIYAKNITDEEAYSFAVALPVTQGAAATLLEETTWGIVGRVYF